MKPILLLVGALIVLGFALRRQMERFQPQFLDTRQTQRTVATDGSSYDQTTNHLDMAGVSMGPMEGTPTPFQVNQYRAHVA